MVVHVGIRDLRDRWGLSETRLGRTRAYGVLLGRCRSLTLPCWQQTCSRS